MVQKETSKKYPTEFLARAVRLVVDHRSDYGSDYGSDNAAFIAISGKLGCSPDSLRVWHRQAECDVGIAQGRPAKRRHGSKPLSVKSVNCARPMRF